MISSETFTKEARLCALLFRSILCTFEVSVGLSRGCFVLSQESGRFIDHKMKKCNLKKKYLYRYLSATCHEKIK